MKKKNKGFTLVEMIVTVSIFVILFGILVPSLNSILGFRVQRAANSIVAGLDKAKIEASNRLVGEMCLEKRSDGYYISYILDRGKADGKENIKWNEDEEKIAPSKTLISYVLKGSSEEHSMVVGDRIILTYERATGAFLPLQKQDTDYWDMMEPDILTRLSKNIDIFQKGDYCEKIIVRGGTRTRTITLNIDAGTYQITAG